MLIRLDKHSGVPVYRQIVDQIRDQVATGALREGDSLPSVRELAGRIKINPMTVSKAYGLLERENLIVRQPGQAYRVDPQPLELKKAARRARLDEVLTQAAVRARQLGIPAEEALAMFERHLDGLKPAAPDKEQW